MMVSRTAKIGAVVQDIRLLGTARAALVTPGRCRCMGVAARNAARSAPDVQMAATTPAAKAATHARTERPEREQPIEGQDIAGPRSARVAGEGRLDRRSRHSSRTSQTRASQGHAGDQPAPEDRSSAPLEVRDRDVGTRAVDQLEDGEHSDEDAAIAKYRSRRPMHDLADPKAADAESTSTAKRNARAKTRIDAAATASQANQETSSVRSLPARCAVGRAKAQCHDAQRPTAPDNRRPPAGAGQPPGRGRSGTGCRTVRTCLDPAQRLDAEPVLIGTPRNREVGRAARVKGVTGCRGDGPGDAVGGVVLRARRRCHPAAQRRAWAPTASRRWSTACILRWISRSGWSTSWSR